MKKRMNLLNPPALPEPNDPALASSLPTWADLPQQYQQELIQALADLLLRQPELQALLEARHEPQP